MLLNFNLEQDNMNFITYITNHEIIVIWESI